MISRTRVKICGITRVEDAVAAVEAGADALGLVFYEPSPRYIDLESARDICEAVAPFVTLTGLFVNHNRATVCRVLERLPLGLLQFHGEESESECSQYGVPYIKAVRVRSRDDIVSANAAYATSQGILVDSYKQGVAGGTGETFDWSLIPETCTKPLILAGGLNTANVRNAIARVRPYAVDVSGGVEQSKGVKDHAKINQFIKEVSRGGNE